MKFLISFVYFPISDAQKKNHFMMILLVPYVYVDLFHFNNCCFLLARPSKHNEKELQAIDEQIAAPGAKINNNTKKIERKIEIFIVFSA